MLDQIKVPNENKGSKQERLQLVVDQVVDSLPTTVRLLAGSYLNSFRQVLESEQQDIDGNIDNALSRLREYIDYIQYGHDQENE
ncbi:hypothetical protein O144_gp08 [Bacillus phage Wip1]|uniref:Uncharacterized protein n=1 Tax=Bacillus phage Wip1 TaxID=663237 RepID=S5Y6I7_9VIRU|nr:hypothetical protein O144_gp08 [Bacillus phage Wip1]AGT13367.1 hypothetical protein [Bacillus phage Wip1]